ncbi:MAG: glycosyltransferase family 4 protein [Verrucomicrobiota bacterium]
MKIALIRRQFSATGGAELYLQRLLGALQQAGHEIHLFAEAWEQPPAGIQFHAIPVEASRAWRAVRFAEGVQQALAGQRFDCVFSLERTLQQDVYRAGDGVHRVWLERRRQFAPWWRKPFIGRGAFHRQMMALEARTFDPANTGRIIVNSDMVKQEILRHFKFPAERIHLVRNGIAVERFQNGKREETRRRFGFSEKDCVLLFVGSGWERKGLQYLLDAVKIIEYMKRFDANGMMPEKPFPGLSKHPAIKLLVVGKGKRPRGTSANVVFAGAMADVEQAYAAADLFVFPPIYEPSSNVVIEALAAGLPVITTAQNGASEWIAPGDNGAVLSEPDTGLLVEAICQWLQKLPRFVYTDAESVSLERNVKETMAVLELAAQGRAGTKGTAI